MRKNTCPYIDSQERCTHKQKSTQLRTREDLTICPFNKAIKCKMYLEWLNQLKARHGIPKREMEEIYGEGEI